MQILPNRFLTVRKQFKFPSSKSKRIRNKWRKQECNFRNVPDPNVYMIGNDMIIGHQATLKCITGFVEKSRKFFVESKRNDMPEEISVRVFDELVRNALMSTMMPIMASNKIFEPMKFYPIEEYNFSRI